MMAWTQAQLLAAYNALSPAPATLSAACAALNAQTTTQTVDVPVSAVEGYLLVNGILPAMQAWAAAHPTDTTGILATIQSLQALVSSPTLQTVAMSDPTTNAAVTKMVGALTTAGLMTSVQEAAILAMATQTAPVWQPAVVVDNLQAMQRAVPPLIATTVPVA